MDALSGRPQPRVAPRQLPRIALLTAVLGAALTAIAANVSAAGDSPDFTLTFLDVGQGDSARLHTDSGFDALIDGATAPKATVITGYLEQHGVAQLDVIAVTHPDADHIGGLATVVAKYPPGLYVSNGETATSATYGTLMAALATAGVPTVVARAGSEFTWDGNSVSVVHPADPASSRNDNSLVLRIGDGQCSALIAGDVEATGEAAILARGTPVASDILKVAHHGSDSSSKLAFVQKVKATAAVVSVGPNSYGHPSTAVIATLEAVGVRVYRTDVDGWVHVASAPGGCRIAAQCDPATDTPEPSATPTETATATPTAASTETPTVTPVGTESGTPAATASPGGSIFLPFLACHAELVPATMTPTLPPPTSTPTASATATSTATKVPTRTSSPTSAPSATSTPPPSPTVPAGALLSIGVLQCKTSDEYVRVDNQGGSSVNLSGWRIFSVVGSQTYNFPSYSLGAGASVYVHSGPDAPPTGGSNLRWTTDYMWNNDGDTAQLKDPSGTVVDEDDC